MKIVNVKSPYNNGFENENDPTALAYIETMKEVREALKEGRLFARFISGDRKGSVCKLVPKYDKEYETYIKRLRLNFNGINYTLENCYLFCLGKWTGRSNKPQITLPNKDIEVIIDYDGPTVWKVFDKKAAKEEILKTPNQRDMDGNLLEVGDKVLYINARYGSGMRLDRGVVKEFKVSVDSNTHSISTVIENEHEILSTINDSSNMVLKQI